MDISSLVDWKTADQSVDYPSDLIESSRIQMKQTFHHHPSKLMSDERCIIRHGQDQRKHCSLGTRSRSILKTVNSLVRVIFVLLYPHPYLVSIIITNHQPLGIDNAALDFIE